MTAGSRPRVVYWNNQPTPYLTARLNAVADRGTIELEAWFDSWREGDRSWAVNPADWRFPARLLQPRPVAGRSVTLPVGELRATRPDLLIGLYDRPLSVAGLMCARTLAGRVAVRCLPRSEAWSETRWYSKAATRFVFDLVDGAKVPGADGRRFAQAHGLPGERIQHVTQSIDVENYQRSLAVSPAERQVQRDALGLDGCVFLYVGRIWSGKGLDTLLAAYRQVRERAHGPVRLLLVGDGADEERMRAETADLPDVVWYGFAQPADLPSVYALADVFVFPTLGDPHGLVIDEALTAGLPVISSSAAGDIDSRVLAGVNGSIVPPRDVPALANRMSELEATPELRRMMAQAAEQRAAHVDVQHYADDFERFVELMLSTPKRVTASSLAGAAAGAALAVAPGGRRQVGRLFRPAVLAPLEHSRVA